MARSTFQPGDICPECQQHGLCNRLRSFYIDINQQIVKCESSSCLYPFENDFSDSEDDVQVKEEPNCASNIRSKLPPEAKSDVNNELEDSESVRFVEALLCVSENNTAAEKSVQLSDPIEHSATYFTLRPATSEQSSTWGNPAENILSSAKEESKIFDSIPHSKTTLDVVERVSSTVKLFTNGETNPNMDTPTTQEAAVSTDMPALTFDFAKIAPPAEQRLIDVKDEQKPKIEIQCIQTVKAGFANTNTNTKLGQGVANTAKIFIESVELIKTEYRKEEPIKPAIATDNSAKTPIEPVSKGETNVRISRYFDAIRVKQEQLQKSQMKPKSTESRKRSTIYKKPQSENGAGGSLVNAVQQLLMKKQQK